MMGAVTSEEASAAYPRGGGVRWEPVAGEGLSEHIARGLRRVLGEEPWPEEPEPGGDAEDDAEAVIVRVPREVARRFVLDYSGPRAGVAWEVVEALAAALLTAGAEEATRPGGWMERLMPRGDLDAMRSRFGWDAPGVAGGGQ